METCNSDFEGDMNAVCDDAYPLICPYTGWKARFCTGYFKERALCLQAAWMYVAGVNNLAAKAYEEDWKGHCQCCK
jgi:hypothetical protein